jgi:2,5-diamino-6-(ribosylamino)-4(3H)-pyrimidinone 5'-phosphate reductase
MSVLTTLQTLGIRTLMIEGGARIIGSFLQSAPEVVDSVILTIAPVIVGQEGTGYLSPGVDNVELVRTMQLGRDTAVGLNVARAV